MSNEKLETLFAIEFGQLIENYLYANPFRDQLIDVVCSCLQLRSKQQLAQVYAGYDTPSTANIFELLRTLNDPELNTRFFGMQTTLPTVEVQDKVQDKVEVIEPVKKQAEPVDTRPYWQREEPNDFDNRKSDVMGDELADMDMDMLKGFDFNL